MATDTSYRPYDFLRVCDICLHRFHFSDLTPIGELRWACRDDAPGFTATQVSRYNARARALRVRPNRNAKPVSQIPTYALPEAATFNFISTVAPAQFQDGASSPLAAAWAATYLADIVIQGLRPATWIATAKISLLKCLNYLLTLQYGSPTGISPAGSIQNPRYGGIKDGTDYVTATTIAAGAAFVKGYQALGDPALLAAADRCATYIRHVQCGDLQISSWTVYPSGGGPYHLGGLASGVVDGTGLLTATYNIADVSALWFLALLVAARSLTSTYGDGAATSFFSLPTVAPLSQMISELTAFAVSGVKDSTANGTLVTGLSTTKPQATYTAAVNGGGGAAAWTFVSTIASDPICLAVLGLYESAGLTSTVSAVIAWLQSFISNPANQTPKQPDSVTILGNTGTYTPSLCVATLLTASAPFEDAAGTTYSWASQGMLSPALSQLSPGLRQSKDTLAHPQRISTQNVALRYLGPQGRSGLSLQPTGTSDVILAAKAGMIFRQPPGIYPRVALF